MYLQSYIVYNLAFKSKKNLLVSRKDIFVVTKLYPNQYDKADKAIEESLKKLDIGYINNTDHGYTDKEEELGKQIVGFIK